MYLGKVVVDEFPYQVHELDKNNQDRLVWKFPLRLVSFKNKEEKEFQDIKFKISEMEEKVKVKLPDVSVTYKEGLPNIRKYNFIEHRKEKNEKTNYILNHMKQTILGDENEKRIFEIEYEKVKNAGALKEAEEMKKSFENKKDHEEYDILSFELNENGIYEKKYIEVKSTVGDESVPIDITDNEREFAKDHLKNYYIYRVVKSSSKVAYYKVIKGEDLFNENIYEFKSTSYKIYSK